MYIDRYARAICAAVVSTSIASVASNWALSAPTDRANSREKSFENPDCISWSPQGGNRAFKNGLPAIADKWNNYRREDERAADLQDELWVGLKCIKAELTGLTNSTISSSAARHVDAVAILAVLERQALAIEDIVKRLKELSLKCPVCTGMATSQNAGTPSQVQIILDSNSAKFLSEWRAFLQEIKLDIKSQRVNCNSKPCCQNCANSAISGDLASSVESLNGSIAAFQATVTSLLQAILEAQKGGPEPPKVTEVQQFDSEADVRSFIPDTDAHIDAALLTIPDPRVPRHRRAYDNAIDAVSNAMLIGGYVLDRFSFPWQAALAKSSDKVNSVNSAKSGSESAEGVEGEKASSGNTRYSADDRHYGLMVFRKDTWRTSEVHVDSFPRTSYRLVYVVPETATYGIQRSAFQRVIARLERELGDGKLTLASSTFCPRLTSKNTALNQNELLVFGPTYSGTVESIRLISKDLAASPDPKTNEPTDGGTHLGGFCLLSPTATAATNRLLAQYTQSMSPMRVVSLAVSDEKRVNFIESLRNVLGVNRNKVAFLYEATVFGNDICGSYVNINDEKKLCGEALQIPFPVNIADIRYGLRAGSAATKKEQKTDIRLPTSAEVHLHLEEGAENGSEFPESDQSDLTTAGNQFNLQHAVEALQARHPLIVVIVATDVRDQLFLMEQVHAQLQGALLIVFGADRLLAHPDFINTSRGAIALSSSALETCIKLNFNGKKAVSSTPDVTVKSPKSRAQQSGNGNDQNPNRDVGIVECENGEQSTALLDTTWVTDDQALLAKAILSWEPSLYASGSPSMHGDEPCTGLVEEVNTRPCPFLVARDGVHGRFGKGSSSFVWRMLPPVVALEALVIALWFFRIGNVRIPGVHRAALGIRAEITARVFPRRLAAIVVFALMIVVLYWLRLGPWRVPFVGGSVFVLALIFHGVFGDLHWQKIAKCVLLVSMVTLLGGEYWHSSFGTPDFSGTDLGFLAETSKDVFRNAVSGLSFPLSILVVLMILVGTSWTASQVGLKLEASRQCLAPLWDQSDRWEKSLRDAGRFTFASLVALMALELASVLGSGLRMTTLGTFAALSAWLSLLAITAVSILMFLGSIGATRRILNLCEVVEEVCRREIAPGTDRDEKWNPLLWDSVPGRWPTFSSTPALSFDRTALDFSRIGLLADVTDIKNRRLLHWLLINEMSMCHWMVISGIASTLGAGIVVYLFPVTGADHLLMMNLAVLFLIGIQSAYASVRFESNRILSNVLCNRSRKVELSAELFTYVAFPFAALAIAIAIAEVPGVLDWGDGVFSLLLETLKPKL